MASDPSLPTSESRLREGEEKHHGFGKMVWSMQRVVWP